MKKLFLLLLAVLLFTAPSFAQVGPGPTPNPWVLNGAQVYYNRGCVSISASTPGGCHGTGSLSVDTFWLNGTQISTFVSSLNFGTTGLTPNTATTGAITVGGTLVVGNGGTGAATFTSHGVLYGNTTSALGVTAAGTTGQYFKGVTSGAPAWGTLASDAVTTFSAGTTGLTPNSATAGAVTLAGTLVVGNGGTGLATLTAHTVPIGAGTSNVTLSSVGATGSVFAGNTSADPTFQTLASLNTVANGGTGVVTLTNHSVLIGAATSAITQSSVGATGTVLAGNTSADPTFQTLASLNTVANGGTGAATLTGVLKGNGTSAFTAATAGSDYVAPGTATTFTATQTFNGSSSVAALSLLNAKEPSTVSATAATGTINYDVTTQSIIYYTSNAGANWTVNFRGSSGTALNTVMATGDTVTVTFAVTQGASPFYNNVVQVDGTTSGITTKWQGGAPAAGNASGIDIYTYAIIKTGSAAFTVFASQTQFK